MVKKKRIIVIFILLISIIFFLYFQNNAIITTNITIQSNRLPRGFDGYKIVHLSDLHGKSFGSNQKNLVRKINEAQPDLIVFTGDLIDSRRYNEEHSMKLLNLIMKIAPVYYVTGNHEWHSGKFDILENSLLNSGIKVLHNSSEKIKKEQDEIYIIGIDDPISGYQIKGENIPKGDMFKILLAHRPEMFFLYSQYDIDVIFSGHAHGGQIRAPFIGGLIAPNQGLLPKYTSGKYTEDNSVMIVSRGLGNSIFPQRLFNRPEIIVVKLIN